MPDQLIEARDTYAARGWVTLPLGLDTMGYPKRPLRRSWQDTTLETLDCPEWAYAKGVGILLGPPSGNLACLDIDCEALAQQVIADLGSRQYLHETARKRCHLLLIEEQPSASARHRVRWQGQTFLIEVRAAGNQIAAPPTPGYRLIGADHPATGPSAEGALLSLAQHYGLDLLDAGTPSRYPTAWRQAVPEGERNDSLFVEACKLAEAGMSYASAVDLLLTRNAQTYAGGGVPQRELIATVRSAYRRAVPASPDESWRRGRHDRPWNTAPTAKSPTAST